MPNLGQLPGEVIDCVTSDFMCAQNHFGSVKKTHLHRVFAGQEVDWSGQLQRDLYALDTFSVPPSVQLLQLQGLHLA